MEEKKDVFGEPEQAISVISRSRQAVRHNRKRFRALLIGTGTATIVFFLFLGVVPQERWERYVPLLIMVPVVLYWTAEAIRGKYPVPGPRELRLERAVFLIYIALMLVTVALCVFVLQPGTWPAAWIGFILAIPCFYGAWKVSAHGGSDIDERTNASQT